MSMSRIVRRLPGLTMLIAAPALAVSAGMWEAKPDLPAPRALHGVGAANGKIYAVGGARRLHCFTLDCYAPEVAEYDPALDTWTNKAPVMPHNGCPTGQPNVRKNHATAVVNGQIYVIGGDNDYCLFSSVHRYDPATDAWFTTTADDPSEPLAPMPVAQSLLAGAATDGVIYVVRDTTVHAYDVAANTWSTTAPMPASRLGPGVTAMDGLLYVAGGSTPVGAQLSSVDVYDPSTDSWSTIDPMPTARHALSLSVSGGKLYAVGGLLAGVGSLRTVELYDPVSGHWTPAPDMLTDRDSFGTAVVDSVLYAIGGRRAQPTGAAVELSGAVEAFAAAAAAPPEIVAAAATPNVLWPPNHEMIDVTVTVQTAGDTDPAPACRIASIASHEAADGTGDGHTEADWEVTGSLTARLRAERSGNGTGRIYTISVVCTDAAGNESAPATATVQVPRERRR